MIQRNSIKSLFIIGFFVATIISCKNVDRSNFKLFSPDNNQCVTVITESNIRYIINGNHDFIPQKNYIKVDVSNIDPIGDAIGICWEQNRYKWEIVNDGALILENKLDTNKYCFNTSWPKDIEGISNTRKYNQDNCIILDILTMKVYPETK